MYDLDSTDNVFAGHATTQLSGEDLLTLSTAAKQTPGRPSVRTLWRWAGNGIRGIRLQTLKVGGRTYTSRQALQRFLNECNRRSAQD